METAGTGLALNCSDPTTECGPSTATVRGMLRRKPVNDKADMADRCGNDPGWEASGATRVPGQPARRTGTMR